VLHIPNKYKELEGKTPPGHWMELISKGTAFLKIGNVTATLLTFEEESRDRQVMNRVTIRGFFGILKCTSQRFPYCESIKLKHVHNATRICGGVRGSCSNEGSG
jgi:hypothetical protein